MVISGEGVEIGAVYSSKLMTKALEARLVESLVFQIFGFGGRCGQVEKVG